MKDCVYILASENCKRLYIGSSTDPGKRLERHNSGGVSATRNKGPWRIVFQQEYDDIKAARQIEAWLKRMKSRTVLEKVIKDGVIVHRV